MLKTHLLAATLVAMAAPAFAGDVAKGEADFKKCKSCHSIVAADGTAIQKGGKIGPNLFGVIGRIAGSQEGFAYGASILVAKDKGVVWDEASLAEYLVDPSVWLQKVTGEPSAKSKMTFKIKDGDDDIAAYLASLK